MNEWVIVDYITVNPDSDLNAPVKKETNLFIPSFTRIHAPYNVSLRVSLRVSLGFTRPCETQGN